MVLSPIPIACPIIVAFLIALNLGAVRWALGPRGDLGLTPQGISRGSRGQTELLV